MIQEQHAAYRNGPKAGSNIVIQPRSTTLDPSQHTVVTVGENVAIMDMEDPDISFGLEHFLNMGQSSGSKAPKPPDKTKAHWTLHLRRPSRNNVKVLKRKASKAPTHSSVMENRDSSMAHARRLKLISDSEVFENTDDGIEPVVALED